MKTTHFQDNRVLLENMHSWVVLGYVSVEPLLSGSSLLQYETLHSYTCHWEWDMCG